MTDQHEIAVTGAPTRTITRYNDEEINLIKDICCPGATDTELKMFLYVCNNTGLDPLLKQIHAVQRYNADLGRKVWSYQTGIDGFRMTAEDTGEYRGVTPGEWYDEKEDRWYDVWTKSHPPDAARIGVLREGFEEPIMGVALWREYKQTKRDGGLTKIWKERGAAQLMKCAESLAFRKAFPRKLGGIYTNEEMAQAENNQEEPVQQPQRASEPTTLDAQVVEGEQFWRGKIIEARVGGASDDPAKPWTLHVLVGHDRQEFTTFSETLHQEAQDYRDDKAVVEIEWREVEKGGRKSRQVVTMHAIKAK